MARQVVTQVTLRDIMREMAKGVGARPGDGESGASLVAAAA